MKTEMYKPKGEEAYSDVRVPAGPFFVRLDGWRFHSLTEKLKLEKPFDRLLAECMDRGSKEHLQIVQSSSGLPLLR